MFAPVDSTVAVFAVLALCAACGSSPERSRRGPTPTARRGADAGDDGRGRRRRPRVGDASGARDDERRAASTVPTRTRRRAEGAPCFTVLTACDYPEGRCGCLLCEMDIQSFGYAWSCRHWDSGGAGCPARSPPLGSPCDGAGLRAATARTAAIRWATISSAATARGKRRRRSSRAATAPARPDFPAEAPWGPRSDGAISSVLASRAWPRALVRGRSLRVGRLGVRGRSARRGAAG